MQVYKEPDALAALGRGDRACCAATTRRSSSTATARYRLRRLRADWPTASPTRSATASASATATGSRCCRQNNPEWCLTFWGTSTSAPILVGLNGWWTTDEIVYGLQDSGAKVLVADRKRFERIADDARRAPRPRARVPRSTPTPADFGGDDPRLHRFDELHRAPPPPTSPTSPIDEDDHAVIFYTSGTTGRPKGAICTHRNMIANLQNTMFNAVAGVDGRRRRAAADAGGGARTSSLFTSPLFHVSGCHSTLVVGLLAGLKLVMPEGRSSPERRSS